MHVNSISYNVICFEVPLQFVAQFEILVGDYIHLLD